MSLSTDETLKKKWNDLSKYQQMDVGARFRNYLQIMSGSPPSIFIPVVPQRDPDHILEILAAPEALPPPIKRAEFRLVRFPDKTAAYVLFDIY